MRMRGTWRLTCGPEGKELGGGALCPASEGHPTSPDKQMPATTAHPTAAAHVLGRLLQF